RPRAIGQLLLHERLAVDGEPDAREADAGLILDDRLVGRPALGQGPVVMPAVPGGEGDQGQDQEPLHGSLHEESRLLRDDSGHATPPHGRRQELAARWSRSEPRRGGQAYSVSGPSPWRPSTDSGNGGLGGPTGAWRNDR